MLETLVANGTQMWLNGIGFRTYSVLGIRIYLAGLYLLASVYLERRARRVGSVSGVWSYLYRIRAIEPRL
jgi:hypothetical protein